MRRCRCKEIDFIDFSSSNILVRREVKSDNDRRWLEYTCLNCSARMLETAMLGSYVIDVSQSNLSIEAMLIEYKIVDEILEQTKRKVTTKQMYYIMYIIFEIFSDKCINKFKKYQFKEVREEIISLVYSLSKEKNIKSFKPLEKTLLEKLSTTGKIVDLEKLKAEKVSYEKLMEYGPIITLKS